MKSANRKRFADVIRQAAHLIPMSMSPIKTSNIGLVTLRIGATAGWHLGGNDKVTVPNRDAANSLIRMGMGMIETQNDIGPKRRDAAVTYAKPKNAL